MPAYRNLTFYAACITFAGMFVLALAWWDLRVVFADNAFVIFNIVKDGWVKIPYFRFIDFANQCVPLTAVHLGIPLKTTLHLYSVAYILIYSSAFLVCTLFFNSPRTGMLVLLSCILITTDTFFYIPSQLLQGLCLLAVGFAALENLNPVIHRKRMVFLFLVVVTLAFAHPLILFPFFFACAYLWLLKDGAYRRQHLIWIMILFILSYVIRRLFFSTWYERSAMDSLNNIVTYFPHYLEINSNRVFLKNCLSHYYWMPLTWLAVNVYYVITRRWLLMGLLNISVIGVIFLLNVTQNHENILRYYIENMYLIIPFMLALPLVFELFPLLAARKLLLPLLLLIIITFYLRVFGAKDYFEARLAWMNDFLDRHRHEKLLIHASQTPREIITLNWATPYEWWILSTIRYGETASLVIDDNPHVIDSLTNQPDIFIGAFHQHFKYESLPARYFNFTDTVMGYRMVDEGSERINP